MSTVKLSPAQTVKDFANYIGYAGSLSFSPDSRTIAYSCNADGQFNLWTKSLDGGEPAQLTHLKAETVRALAWSPNNSAILFTADTDGNENFQLKSIAPTGGEIKSLTDRPDVQFVISGSPWSPDGQLIAYAGNDREASAQDVIVKEAPTGEDDRVVADGRYNQPASWSPDGVRLVGVDARGNIDTRIYLIDAQTGVRTDILPDAESGLYSPGPWKADGSGFWLISDQGREFAGLAFYEVATDSMTWVETPEWDVEYVATSSDGRYLVWATNENGYSRISVRDLQSGKLVDLPAIPGGTIKPYSTGLVFAPDGNQIAFLMESPIQPAEIFLLDLQAKSLRQITSSLRVDLSSLPRVEPEAVSFPAFDGQTIPALVFRPEGEGPFPVVISIHGGPEGQERPNYAYRGFYQALLSQGIGVVTPNIRGSSGYGKSYQKLIHRDLGGNDVKDFETVARYAQSLDWVDPERMGVFGGSYGGFAVLTCVSRLPEMNWAAAVDLVGPSNLVTMLRSFPPTWKEVAKAVFGDVDTEEEDLLRRSPISYVDQIKAPLFVIQGANDPRVVQAESDQIVAQLRERGVPVKYDIYPDEGHGFTKKENELKGFSDMATFLVERLVG